MISHKSISLNILKSLPTRSQPLHGLATPLLKIHARHYHPNSPGQSYINTCPMAQSSWTRVFVPKNPKSMELRVMMARHRLIWEAFHGKNSTPGTRWEFSEEQRIFIDEALSCVSEDKDDINAYRDAIVYPRDSCMTLYLRDVANQPHKSDMTVLLLLLILLIPFHWGMQKAAPRESQIQKLQTDGPIKWSRPTRIIVQGSNFTLQDLQMEEQRALNLKPRLLSPDDPITKDVNRVLQRILAVCQDSPAPQPKWRLMVVDAPGRFPYSFTMPPLLIISARSTEDRYI
jgi:hypothetical protein